MAGMFASDNQRAGPGKWRKMALANWSNAYGFCSSSMPFRPCSTWTRVFGGAQGARRGAAAAADSFAAGAASAATPQHAANSMDFDLHQ